MEQKNLAGWLKAIVIGIGICGIYIYASVIPGYGEMLVRQNPEFTYCYMPWLIFLSCTAIPVYIALHFAWKIFANIGNDHSFCEVNAKYLKWISWLAGGDAAYFFLGNIILTFLNMNHPGVILYSLIVVFAGVAVSVASAALSHLVLKAALLQEESDLTV